jgi:hypothetical protein
MQVNIESDVKHEIMNSEETFLAFESRKLLEKNKKGIYFMSFVVSLFRDLGSRPAGNRCREGKGCEAR